METISDYFKKIGKLGGSSKSEAKVEAVKKNLEKARGARKKRK